MIGWHLIFSLMLTKLSLIQLYFSILVVSVLQHYFYYYVCCCFALVVKCTHVHSTTSSSQCLNVCHANVWNVASKRHENCLNSRRTNDDHDDRSVLLKWERWRGQPWWSSSCFSSSWSRLLYTYMSLSYYVPKSLFSFYLPSSVSNHSVTQAVPTTT